MIAYRVRLPAAAAAALLLNVTPALSQSAEPQASGVPVVRVVAVSVGSIFGTVLDDGGTPVEGAVVSALGGATSFAVTDDTGRYRLSDLPAGPYVVRVHREGYAAARSTLVNVRPAARASSSFTLRRVEGASGDVKAAGVPGVDTLAEPRDESALAWRLRRLTRSVLKDEDGGVVPAPEPDGEWPEADGAGFFSRAFDVASNVLSSWPLNGQVNLLTATAYDDADEMVEFGPASGVAFLAVGAPVGDQGDWSAKATMNSGDISSWAMAGDYASRPSARHQVAVGMTHTLQTYRGGNIAALQAVPEGHRRVTSIYGRHEFPLAPGWQVGYGTRYEHFDYLASRGLLSPTGSVTFSPARGWRVRALASLQQVAPGAEEFVPPADALWVPPQRTFAPLGANRFRTERVQHLEVGVTRAYRGTALELRTFGQAVENQLVTVFGVADPDGLVSAGGHYGVAVAGDASLRGWTAGITQDFTPNVQARLDYTLVTAHWNRSSGPDDRALVDMAPQAIRDPHERIHDLTASIDAGVPLTATRFHVVYKIDTGFTGTSTLDKAAARFDMQLRQGLPFLDGAGDWEMLLGVRSLFRSSLDDRSIYDELLVVRAPKRLVGGLQVRF
ncbi:MAG: TonB-dependent receptor [Vicinamibacterales bacterium]